VFGKSGQNPVPAKFLAGCGGFADYFKIKVLKLALVCYHVGDFTHISAEELA